jgi:hypothetical protein
MAVSIVVNFEEGAEFSINDGDPENEAVYEIEQRLAGRPDPGRDKPATNAFASRAEGRGRRRA